MAMASAVTTGDVGGAIRGWPAFGENDVRNTRHEPGPRAAGGADSSGVVNFNGRSGSDLRIDSFTQACQKPVRREKDLEEGEICAEVDPRPTSRTTLVEGYGKEGVEFESDTESGEIRSSEETSIAEQDSPSTLAAVSTKSGNAPQYVQKSVPTAKKGFSSPRTRKPTKKIGLASTPSTLNGAVNSKRRVLSPVHKLPAGKKEQEKGDRNNARSNSQNLICEPARVAAMLLHDAVDTGDKKAKSVGRLDGQSNFESRPNPEQGGFSSCRCSRHLKRARYFKSQGGRVRLNLGLK